MCKHKIWYCMKRTHRAEPDEDLSTHYFWDVYLNIYFCFSHTNIIVIFSISQTFRVHEREGIEHRNERAWTFIPYITNGWFFIFKIFILQTLHVSKMIWYGLFKYFTYADLYFAKKKHKRSDCLTFSNVYFSFFNIKVSFTDFW